MAAPSSTPFWSLPDDVLLSVFSFLPIRDLARCATVCRRWHGIVAEFSAVWKGKRFVTSRSPRESDVTRAVLNALPPFPEVSIQAAYDFAMEVCYPRLVLSVTDVASIKHCPSLRCKCLTGSLEIVGACLSYRWVVDFAALTKLRILGRSVPNVWLLPTYGVEYVVSTALDMLPNLRELSVCTEFLSAHYLDGLQGIGRLRTLEIECTGLQRLAFLRHCAAELQELQLMGCSGLPSEEYAELRRLANLRGLRLRDCTLEQGHLAAAVSALTRLESLKLNRCGFVSDLSFLEQCGQLREVCITNSTAPDLVLTVTAATPAVGVPWLRHFRLPAAEDKHSFGLVSVTLTLGEGDAMPGLERLRLSAACRDFLGPLLRSCPRLRHICCEFLCEPDEPELFTRRVHIDLSSPAET